MLDHYYKCTVTNKLLLLNMKLFLHFIDKDTEGIDTVIAQLDTDLTLLQLKQLAIIDYRRDIHPQRVTVHTEYKKDKLQNMDEHVSKHFAEGADVFLVYEKMKPLKVEQSQKEELYETISKYAFVDDETKVLVYLELPGVGALPKQNIISRFLERSFEVKVKDYKGKNLKFAVPKTHCTLVPEKSKVIQKADKLTISLLKTNPKDNWYSLYKSKAVGQAEQL